MRGAHRELLPSCKYEVPLTHISGAEGTLIEEPTAAPGLIWGLQGRTVSLSHSEDSNVGGGNETGLMGISGVCFETSGEANPSPSGKLILIHAPCINAIRS